MREEILGILADIRPDIDFENETALITDGVLDSFDIVSIVGDFNEAFNIDIHIEDLLPENFNSPDAMVELVEKLKDENRC